ncbi:HalOD1 output domain-containing protein [Halobaculum gomorrense]|uniref:HalOD1 output domain-containing protein n=1 Tax=Halobaculum gomorrense TaxID=43928 RepID=UPI00190E65F7
MQPLYEAIDPDALDQLFESPHQLQKGCIMFRYEECNVTVDAGEGITVRPG